MKIFKFYIKDLITQLYKSLKENPLKKNKKLDNRMKMMKKI